MSEGKFLQAKPIVDFPAVEQSISDFWRENRIFEKSLEARRGAPQFTFYEGPPTANGLPHNGHVLTRVFKDVFLRYQTMRGRYVPRKAGWDTHGLPVEVEVEKELGIHGKEAIEAYGVEKFIAKCIDSVFRYTHEWERMTEKVGFWVDLEDAYVTYHRSYVESVWWALSELFKKDLLYQGHKIVWWWPQGGTALSAGEVGLGYKTVEDPSVYVKFPLVDEPGKSLLIWTTTPWTLPSNQYAAVGAELDYVEVEDEEHGVLILAAALRETIAGKLGRDLPVLRELKGAELLDRKRIVRRSTFSTTSSRIWRSFTRATASQGFGGCWRRTSWSWSRARAWCIRRRRSARWTTTCTGRWSRRTRTGAPYRCFGRWDRTASSRRKFRRSKGSTSRKRTSSSSACCGTRACWCTARATSTSIRSAGGRTTIR